MTLVLSNSSFIAGELITISNVNQNTNGFVNAEGANVDPTVVLLKWSVNGTAPTTLTYPTGITKVSTGVYSAILDSTGLAGIWTVEWIGDPKGTEDPTCQAIIAGTFKVVSAPL